MCCQLKDITSKNLLGNGIRYPENGKYESVEKEKVPKDGETNKEDKVPKDGRICICKEETPRDWKD